MTTLTFILLLVIGVYLVFGAALFRIGLKTRRAQRMIGAIGEAGTRILYAAIGIALVVVALVMYL